ncbi:hypothetical protein [Rhodanobacter sp. 115]|uniref:hypothetical protein n=1 Tax=Rhodanobacter sp. FW021-MT20 TaxID=1162282 RepID=UPI000260DED7|nr:hypothetical protein [Rhodanobacter sp. 115]EIM02324.1 hypothetical protein UU5_01272 [Rhodanobacter sp. 115]
MELLLVKRLGSFVPQYGVRIVCENPRLLRGEAARRHAFYNLQNAAHCVARSDMGQAPPGLDKVVTPPHLAIAIEGLHEVVRRAIGQRSYLDHGQTEGLVAPEIELHLVRRTNVCLIEKIIQDGPAGKRGLPDLTDGPEYLVGIKRRLFACEPRQLAEQLPRWFRHQPLIAGPLEDCSLTVQQGISELGRRPPSYRDPKVGIGKCSGRFQPGNPVRPLGQS